MALKAFYANIEDVPEALRNEYVATTLEDGREIFRLDVSPQEGWELDNIANLKSALSREKEDRRKARETIAEFGDLKPSEMKLKLKALAELEKLDPKTEAGRIAEKQIEAIKTEMGSLHQTEMAAEKERGSKYRKAAETLLVDDQIRAALAETKGSPDLLLPIMRGNVQIREDNGDLAAVVVDSAGNPRIGDASGERPFTILQLAHEYKDNKTYAPAFEGSMSGGSGAPTSKTPGAGGQGAQPSAVDKIQAGLEKAGLT